MCYILTTVGTAGCTGSTIWPAWLPASPSKIVLLHFPLVPSHNYSYFTKRPEKEQIRNSLSDRSLCCFPCLREYWMISPPATGSGSAPFTLPLTIRAFSMTSHTGHQSSARRKLQETREPFFLSSPGHHCYQTLVEKHSVTEEFVPHMLQFVT